MRRVSLWLASLVVIGLVALLVYLISLLAMLVRSDEGEASYPLAGEGNLLRGAQIFVREACGDCHTLAAVSARGKNGPDLDAHLRNQRHDLNMLIAEIANGGGIMPAYRERLSADELRDVAFFVILAAGVEERP